MSDIKKNNYPLTISPMFTTTKNGEPNSNYLQGLEINDELYDAIQKIEKGGRLFVRVIPEERRGKVYAYVEYKTPQDIADYKAKREAEKQDVV